MYVSKKVGLALGDGSTGAHASVGTTEFMFAEWFPLDKRNEEWGSVIRKGEIEVEIIADDQ
jgi:hypothetical protein